MSPGEMQEILSALERMRKTMKEDIDAIGGTLLKYMEKLDQHAEENKKAFAKHDQMLAELKQASEKRDRMWDDHERWLREHNVRLDRLEAR